MDIFVLRLVLVALILAVTTGPLGCFVVWRRMAYFGETIAHASLLGVAFSFAWGGGLLSVVLVVLALALILIVWQDQSALASDTLLGILAHGSLAIGLLLLSLFVNNQSAVTALLFGDILAVTWSDVLLLALLAVLVLGVLVSFWHGLLAQTIDKDIAKVEYRHPRRYEFLFVLLLSLVIALAINIIGVLLITAMLIIPAATARIVAKSPESMAFWAIGFCALANTLGIFVSFQIDTPLGPSIVLCSLTCLALSGVGNLVYTHVRS